jgi:hypothetical protein
VTRHRLAILVTLFGELGLPPATARRRALLAYSAYLGHAQLSHTTPQPLPHLAEINRLETWLWLDGPAQPEGRVAGPAHQPYLEHPDQVADLLIRALAES